MRTTLARLARTAVAALALLAVPAVARGSACDGSLTGTWTDPSSQRFRIVETDGQVSVFIYTVAATARGRGITLGGGRDGDGVSALYTFLPFPAGLLMTVRSCDVLEARWFTVQGGGSTGPTFILQRQSNGYCGDGTVGQDEECDDGNFDDRDSCTDVCLRPRCGDAVRDIGEACDDGNPANRDGCSTACRREVPGAPQACPDLSGTWHVSNGTWGNSGPWTIHHARGGALEAVSFTPGSRDLVASRVAFTGRERSGRIQLVGLERYFEREIEIRLTGAALSCDRLELQPVGPTDDTTFPPLYVLERDARAFCGDGAIDGDEQCDDGNLRAGDGCSFACTLPLCGDGLVDPGEDCDPGEIARDATCELCSRDTAPCADLTGTWRGDGTLFLDGERTVDGLRLSLVDDGRGSLRGAVAGDALGLRREIWLSIEGAHAGTDLWLATSVRTTAPIDDPSPGLSTVLSGTLDRCDAFQIDGARFSRIATGFCGDRRRRDGESCDDGNMASGDGCSASCAPERTRGRTTLPRLGDR